MEAAALAGEVDSEAAVAFTAEVVSAVEGSMEVAVNSEGAASRKGQADLVVDFALLTHRVRLVAASLVGTVALVVCRERIDRT